MYAKIHLLVLLAMAAYSAAETINSLCGFLACNCRIMQILPWYTSGFE